MCAIDLDPCDVWQETPRKARKEHVCTSCDGKIQTGERYLVHFSIFDGSICHGKLCSACEAARAEFTDEHDGMLPQPDYFPQLLSDCVADGDEGSKKWAKMLVALHTRGLRAEVPARA